MTEISLAAERQAWLLKERRDAYLAALRVIDLDLRRSRYRREGKQDKLEQVESFWPKVERVRMSMEALIGVNMFGSGAARRLADEWAVALESDDEAEPARVMRHIQDQLRRELNPGLGDEAEGPRRPR
ncbi:hypothetical protein ABZ399_27345 [Micromonospora aurantiaca]|uniref:hypothetical protein n=1 Tax=Micromonospora aurantiaca (nom. illeg.) TaxID=47850 RepID=UPI0033C75B94